MVAFVVLAVTVTVAELVIGGYLAWRILLSPRHMVLVCSAACLGLKMWVYEPTNPGPGERLPPVPPRRKRAVNITITILLLAILVSALRMFPEFMHGHGGDSE